MSTVFFLLFFFYSCLSSSKRHRRSRSYGTITFEGFTVDLDFWCNTEVLGYLPPKLLSNCFTLAKWSAAVSDYTALTSLVTDTFKVIHYLPSEIPLGGEFCCGSDTFVQRGLILGNPTIFVPGSLFSNNRTIMSVSETVVHVRQDFVGTVTSTDISYFSPSSNIYYFNEKGLIYLLEVWNEPSSWIEAFEL